MTRVLSPDDPPLPPGYEERPERRCVFALETMSGGYKGLAFAILLRAVEDGCNADWMKEIAEAYEVELPRGLLDRKPSTRVIMDKSFTRYVSIDVDRSGKKPLLSWADGLAVRG